MKPTLLALILLFVLACPSDDNPKTSGDGSFIEFSLDGVDIPISKKSTSFSANENCDYIFATISHVADDETFRFRMEFELTANGHIDNVRFVEYSDHNRHYNTVNFKPAETFSINNFNYDPAAQQLYFEFEGDLYDVDHQGYKKHISGKFKYNSATSVNCGFFQRHVTMDNDTIHFTKWAAYESDIRTLYEFYSDNGYLLHIYSDTNIINVAPANYDFNSGSPLRIHIYKYIGETKATPTQMLYASEWEFYNCYGTITVSSHNLQPFSHTTGTFSFNASNIEGNIIFENLTGNFQL